MANTKRPAHNRIDLSGQKINEWAVISYCETRGKQPFWNCICSCGEEKIVGSNSLRNGSMSCGHLVKGWEKGKKRSESSNEYMTLRRVFSGYRCGAKQRNLEYNLTFDEFFDLVYKDCYYCGKSREDSSRETCWNKELTVYYNGIDRIDNSKGYTLNNCVTCCKSCNTKKRHIPVWLVEKIYNLMVEKCIIIK